MRVIKFNINTTTYETFVSMCKDEGITIKKKLNVLVAKYSARDTDVDAYFTEELTSETRSITLKINEELYKSFMKSSDRLGLNLRRFIPYLIYRLIREEGK